MLDDLEVGVERTDSKLSGAMRRMRKFIRQTEGISFLFCLTLMNDIRFIIDRNEIWVVYNHSGYHPHDFAASCDLGLRVNRDVNGPLLITYEIQLHFN